MFESAKLSDSSADRLYLISKLCDLLIHKFYYENSLLSKRILRSVPILKELNPFFIFFFFYSFIYIIINIIYIKLYYNVLIVYFFNFNSKNRKK